MARSLEEIKDRKRKRKRVLENALEEIKKQLVAMGALKIILFGSLAKGNSKSWSDIDILCVMPSTRKGRAWQRKIYEELDRNIASDILAYTKEELEQTIPVSRFVRQVLLEGKIIYEKETERGST